MSKLTIVKVIGRGDPSFFAEDMERWSDILASKRMSLEEAEKTKEVQGDHVDVAKPDDSGEYITIVKVGSDDYMPTIADLESWRNLFKEAKDSPDFTIFCHPSVEISHIKIGKIVSVE